MARYRWTLALILICLPILATVITAFRIRDIPKGSHDKSDVKTRKCEDCDVNEIKVGQKLPSVDIESEKQSYEQVKKAVREKQQVLSQKKSESKISFKFEDDSDDDDDDDSSELNLLSGRLKRQETTKVIKSGKSDIDAKAKYSNKKLTIKDDDDDDDDDDEDDDDDNEKTSSSTSKRKTVSPSVKPSVASPTKSVIKEATSKKIQTKSKLSADNDDDDDDDDDDHDDDDDDDEDDDDDDNDDNKVLQLRQKSPHKPIGNEGKHQLDVRLKKDQKDESQIKTSTGKDKIEIMSNAIKEKAKDKESTSETVRKQPKKAEPVKKEKIPESKQEKDVQKSKKLKEEEKTNPTTPNLPIKKENKNTPEILKETDTKQKVTEKHTDKPKEKPKEPKKEEVRKPENKVTEPKVDKPKESPKSQPESKINRKTKDKSLLEDLHKNREVSSKSETHLKEVADAVRRRNLLQSEFEDFYAFFPTFAPNFSRIHNPECRRHGQILLRQLRGTKLWALNMLDATAKIPSGLLQGNGIQLGDFDQCLGSRARVQLETGSVVKVQGKYCLARLDVRAEHKELEVAVHLAQGKNLIKSRIDDPGHFVPRFSTLSWGICVPSACNPGDVEVVVKDALLHYQHTSGLVIRVKVDESDCHTSTGSDWWEDWVEVPTLLTLAFYGVVFLLVLVASVQDFLSRRKSEEAENLEIPDDKAEPVQKETDDDEKEKVLESKQPDGFVSAFSLYRTINKLVAPGSTDEIPCIHGVRGLATIALLIAHKFLPVAVMPYTNRVKIAEVASSPLWSWCRAGWVYTDCFLLLSGALTAHRIADSDTSAPKRLLSRYLRLTPALFAVVLFYAYIWDNLSSGPMWGTLVTKNAEVCQEGWWWNLLYVQNYFGFEDMCAPQTHQLALDMQLTILGGIIVWALQAKEGVFKLLLPTIHILTAYSRYTTVRDHRLTMLAYHGVSVSQLYRTARLSYTSTFHRSTPYIVGLSLGMALKKPSQHGKFVLTLGWLFSLGLWSLVWWSGLDSGSPQYRYSATFAAQYAAFAPIGSALAIAWVIYVVHSGNCEFLSSALSWRPLVLISRLSYALYLCQFVVFLTIAGTVKTSTEFTLLSLIDMQEISAILLSSAVLTLTFVIPMQSLHKISFNSKKDDEETTETQESEASELKIEEPETEKIMQEKDEEEIDLPTIRSRQYLVAHREVLEEIPEVEVEYEAQRESIEGLEEILEEEEDEEGVEDDTQDHEDEDLEIIEEEQGGEDEVWEEREEYPQGRPYSRNHEEDRDLDEWEWTTNGSGRSGAQYYHYSR